MTVLESSNSYRNLIVASASKIDFLLQNYNLSYDTKDIFLICEQEYSKYLNQDDKDLPSITRNINFSTALSKERVECPNLNHGVISNLIIINTEKCIELDISEDELTSLIAHELGHIFNKYVEQPLPVLITNNDIDINAYTKYQEVKESNKLNKEIWADNFAVKLELKEPLKRLMQKHLDKFPLIERDSFQKRLSELV